MINMTLVLRQSGIVDVYSDFELVETVVRWEKDLFCTDIQCDSEFFYLHFRRVRLQTEEETKQTEENQEEDSSDDDDNENDEDNTIVYRISLQWRSQFKYSYRERISCEDGGWTSIQQKNLSQFMCLYPHWFVLSGYFIIAHRCYISVYDLQKPKPLDEVDEDSKERENLWILHKRVGKSDEDCDYIRSLFLEKQVASEKKQRNENAEQYGRYHAQKNYSMYARYVITAIVGTNQVLRYQLKRPKEQTKDLPVEIVEYEPPAKKKKDG